jgi:16S rRNA (guanine527-N7)-methyltransferase
MTSSSSHSRGKGSPKDPRKNSGTAPKSPSKTPSQKGEAPRKSESSKDSAKSWSPKTFGFGSTTDRSNQAKATSPQAKAKSANTESEGGERERRKPAARTQGAPKVQPNLQGLKTLMAWHGVELKPEVLDKIWTYHQMIRENNDDGDLTRLRAFETMVLRHYVDCTLINAFVKEWPNRMIDVGSGAGFPGIPLAIVNPQIRLTLCEPRPRRVEFLNRVIQKLGLKNVDVFGHKVTSSSMDIPVMGVITRAFEDFQTTLLRVDRALQPGGRAYFLKGPAAREEVLAGIPEGYRLIQETCYDLPRSQEHRVFLELERLA